MQPLFLLHGALGSHEQFSGLGDPFREKYSIHIPDLPGHGRNPGPASSFSIPFFARYVLEQMDQLGIDKTGFLGYSMGGYVALYFARFFPERTTGVITIGTKFNWTPQTAAAERSMLDPEKIKVKIPAFADMLMHRHGAGRWEEVLHRTGEMIRELGESPPLKPEDLRAVTPPVLLLVGDRDKMVGWEETVQTYQQLPRAAMGMLPYTAHALEQVRPEVLMHYSDLVFN